MTAHEDHWTFRAQWGHPAGRSMRRAANLRPGTARRRGTGLIVAGVVLLVAAAALAGWMLVPRPASAPPAAPAAPEVTTAVVPLLSFGSTLDPAEPADSSGILAGRWPAVDSGAFVGVGAKLAELARVDVSRPRPLPTAGDVQRAFLSTAGAPVLDALGVTPARLAGHYVTIEWLRARLLDAGAAVSSVKISMAALTTLAAAAPEETDWNEGPHLLSQEKYRLAVALLADQLAADLHRLGAEIAAGEPGIGADTPGARHIICAAEPPRLPAPVRTADGVVTNCEGDR